MINNNVVDLTGYFFNYMFKDFGSNSSIFFIISVPNRYKNNEGTYVTQYDNVSCVLNSKKDENGQNTKSFEHFKNNLTEKQFIRIQGRIRSWVEGIVDGKLVPITIENEGKATKQITRNIIRVTNYDSNLGKNKSDSEVKLKTETREVKEVIIESEQEEVNISASAQTNFYPDLDLPMYKNFLLN